MSIAITITGSDSIFLTDNSVAVCESSTLGMTNAYLEGSVNTIKLTGTADLNILRGESVDVMKLCAWALKSSADPDCYRSIVIEMYDSMGLPLQCIAYDKCFVLDYEDKFTSTEGRAAFSITLRQL